MRLLFMFVLAFIMSACTITHFEKGVGGGYKASNYSLGMDRESVKVTSPGTTVEIGTSNSSNSGDKINDGLRLILEGAKGIN